MLKKLEFKSNQDPIVTEYNIMAMNSGLQTFSPKSKAIIELEDLQQRRAQFLGNSYNSENPHFNLKKSKGEENYFSMNPYLNQTGNIENEDSYNPESSFIDLKNQVSNEDFSQGMPLDFQKCQNLNSSDSNIFNVFNKIGEERKAVIGNFVEDNLADFQSSNDFYYGKENTKSWKGVEHLNLNYHSVEVRDKDKFKKETMIKSRYLSDQEKEKIDFMEFKCENIEENPENELEVERKELTNLKISKILPKVESQNFVENKSIEEFKIEEDEHSETAFHIPRPSISHSQASKTVYESFTNENYDIILRSPTRKVEEWTPNPYSPYQTCHKKEIDEKDFRSLNFPIGGRATKYIQDPLLFAPKKKNLSFKEFLKEILKKNKGYINYELELALKKFEDNPIFKQRIVDFLDKKYLNNTAIWQKRINWRQDEIKIMQNFYSKNKIEAFTDVSNFRDKSKNDRFLGVVSTSLKDKSSIYSLMDNRGKKVLLTVKRLPEGLKKLKTQVVKKRHLYRSPSKIALDLYRKDHSKNLENEVPCLMFLNKKKQFLHVFDLLKRRNLNVFTIKDSRGELAEVVDYDNNGEEIYVVTRRKIVVFSIFDFSMKKQLDLIDEVLSVFYAGYGRVMLLPKFGNLIEILNLEINTRKFIVFEKKCLQSKKTVLQGGKFNFLKFFFRFY